MINIDPPSSPASTDLNKSALTRFLNRARVAVGLSGEVDVLLSDDATLKRLNKAYRGKNKATDVLSFPAPEIPGAEMAGDLAISLETAERQAASFGHSLFEEVRILLLHGLLHLDGEDHESDTGEMAAREMDLRIQLKLPNSLIDRVEMGHAPVRARRVTKAATTKKQVAATSVRAAKATEPPARKVVRTQAALPTGSKGANKPASNVASKTPSKPASKTSAETPARTPAKTVSKTSTKTAPKTTSNVAAKTVSKAAGRASKRKSQA